MKSGNLKKNNLNENIDYIYLDLHIESFKFGNIC